ncbi:hypothetical protein RMATCC62417_16683 [Rhizopus microsporus]|nr:hypothetical protein RMATCC62417_16683 [Rhizopus microsporus]
MVNCCYNEKQLFLFVSFTFFSLFLFKMRLITYPETEQRIQDKKRQKLAAGIGEERYSSNSSKRGGKRKKDTPEEKRAKADARKKEEQNRLPHHLELFVSHVANQIILSLPLVFVPTMITPSKRD